MNPKTLQSQNHQGRAWGGVKSPNPVSRLGSNPNGLPPRADMQVTRAVSR